MAASSQESTEGILTSPDNDSNEDGEALLVVQHRSRMSSEGSASGEYGEALLVVQHRSRSSSEGLELSWTEIRQTASHFPPLRLNERRSTKVRELGVAAGVQRELGVAAAGAQLELGVAAIETKPQSHPYEDAMTKTRAKRSSEPGPMPPSAKRMNEPAAGRVFDAEHRLWLPARLGTSRSFFEGFMRKPPVQAFNATHMKELYGSLKDSRRPWLDEYNPHMKGYPQSSTTGKKICRLYDTFPICDILDEHIEDLYYIDLFFQKRFYTSILRIGELQGPDRLRQAWEKFLENYISSPSKFKASVELERSKFMRLTSSGGAMELHRMSIAEKLPCAVPPTYHCPLCYSDSPRMPYDVHKDPDYVVPEEILIKRRSLCDRFNISIVKKDNSHFLTTGESREIRRIEQVLSRVNEQYSDVSATTKITTQELKRLQSDHARLESDHTRLEFEHAKLQSMFTKATEDIAHLHELIMRHCNQ